MHRFPPQAADSGKTERKPIRIDFPQRQEGIAAALRRAFAEAGQPNEDIEQWERLLERLH